MDLELDPYLIERKRIIRRRWKIAGVVALVVGIVAWQWTPISNAARCWRSKRLAASAEESLSKGDIKEAFDSAQSAYYLNPSGAPAIRAVAHVLDATGKPFDALPFWRQLTALPEATFEDRQAVAEDLLRIGAVEDAAKSVGTLLSEQPKSPPILRLSARLEAAQGRLPEALARAKESLEIDPQNSDGRLLVATLLTQSDAEADRAAAFESLWQLSAEPGTARLRALEMLAMWK